MSHLITNKSVSFESRTIKTRESQRKTLILYNIHPNLKVCKSSLASSYKNKGFSADFQREFLLSGSKLKRNEKTITNHNFFKESHIQNQENIEKNDAVLKDSQNIDTRKKSEIIGEDENFQENEKNIDYFENIGNLKQSLISEKMEKNEEKQKNEKNPKKSEIYQNPIKISKKSVDKKPHEFLKIEENPKKLKIHSIAFIKPLDNFFESHEHNKSHQREEIGSNSIKSHDFYELKGQYFKNYKYKRDDREVFFLDDKSFGQNTKNKLPLIGARGFPSIESILQQATNNQEQPKSNTFEKLREDYFVWKDKFMENREKTKDLEQNQENFSNNKKNNSKTTLNMNFHMKIQKKAYENKPKTSDGVMKTILINSIHDYEDREDKEFNNSIHQSKNGDIINCGFKRNYSRKFNEIYEEFQKLIEKQRNLNDNLEIVGLKKNIDIIEIMKNEEKEKNRLKKTKKQHFTKSQKNNQETRLSLDIFKKCFRFIRRNNEKIIQRIMHIFGMNEKEKSMDFNNFMKFYEIFIEKQPKIEKLIEFIKDFLMPDEINSITHFLQNLKLLLKNVNDSNKKKETYEILLEILKEFEIIDENKKILKMENFSKIFISNRISPMELIILIRNNNI